MEKKDRINVDTDWSRPRVWTVSHSGVSPMEKLIEQAEREFELTEEGASRYQEILHKVVDNLVVTSTLSVISSLPIPEGITAFDLSEKEREEINTIGIVRTKYQGKKAYIVGSQFLRIISTDRNNFFAGPQQSLKTNEENGRWIISATNQLISTIAEIFGAELKTQGIIPLISPKSAIKDRILCLAQTAQAQPASNRV